MRQVEFYDQDVSTATPGLAGRAAVGGRDMADYEGTAKTSSATMKLTRSSRSTQGTRW